MPAKVAINGFGRIGRNVFKCILEDNDCASLFEVVAVNDLTDPKTLAHLFKFDSVQGITSAQVEATEEGLTINGKIIRILAERDPAALPWKELGVDLVIESTGIFTKRADAEKHLTAGAKKVVISAPATDPDVTLVLGVNEDMYKPGSDKIISNASCTTNCLAPITKILHEKLGIERGVMTTIHSFTNDQQILDLPHKDLRRARAASVSMIPTTTGAAKAVTRVMPELEGKLDGMAIRVPTPNVSIVDFVADVGNDTTAEEVNDMFKTASEGDLNGVLGYETAPLVSVDYNGNSCSSIVDALSTKVIGKRLVKVLAWYDNEWGYSSRIRDLLKLIVNKGL
ncbi:MAG: type I glyceraldehyde-3-phosphate dehydrogenase [Nitrospinaceae bacterium]|jgi:glyceraldehyde 3-phosphate dehydrogenase|nr:type I glyceraldehyde-3-phosphate dehydrogenase [Nitrospinaceae bacterium]HAK37670.1 type I glyceraldehyde-3-phosphate dehydrogenase [Nitrospina sp.]|tara:strand:- start:1498 stop:2517 length:1020 start_codon:yes stop_codon:yes gene_type:complete